MAALSPTTIPDHPDSTTGKENLQIDEDDVSEVSENVAKNDIEQHALEVEKKDDNDQAILLSDDEEQSDGTNRKRKIGVPPTTPKSQTSRVNKEAREAERAKQKLEREAAATAKRLEKDRIAKEKEELREAKRKEDEEKKEKKRLEDKERRDKKMKEEEDRKERKRKEEEGKNEDRRKKEEERKKKEEDKSRKKQEEEEKKEQRRIDEEEKKMAKMKEEMAVEEKKRRQSNLFKSFFKQGDKKEEKSSMMEEDDGSSSTPLSSTTGGQELWFKPYRIRPFSTLAPIHWREVLPVETHLWGESVEVTDYLAGIKNTKLKGRKRLSSKAKLFHFHDNYRPPYFGTWRTRSKQITGRRPFAKEETLEYEVDSDNEWEEEPSDAEECRSDDEDAVEDEEMDEDEHEGFFVEHGYLSEGEGESDEDEVDEESRDNSRVDTPNGDTPSKKTKDGEMNSAKRSRRVELVSDDEEEERAEVDDNEKKRGKDGDKSAKHARHSNEKLAPTRDTEEERRARLASRAREFSASVARKKAKLVPSIWWNLSAPCDSGRTLSSADQPHPWSSVVQCPEELTHCKIVTIDWPIEEHQLVSEEVLQPLVI